MSKLIGLLGQGVGVVAEYREHRKDQKLSRENSRQDVNAEAGPSNARDTSGTDLPPAYADESSSRSISSGNPASSDKKAAQSQYNDHDDDDISVEDDEEDWRLDEMLSRGESAGLPSYNESEKQYANADLVRDVMSTQKPKGLSSAMSTYQPLPYPVILPQRRPGNKARGFVRAYAPLLGECSGIDQDTFLAFLENFYKSSQASPVFGVIQLAAGIAGFAPGMIAMAVTTSVQIAAQVGKEAQARYRTNDFLNKMNEELFKPKGLFAMIVKYQTDQEVQASGNGILARFGVSGESVDVGTNQTIAKYNSQSSGMTQKMQNLRLASSNTQGAVNIPEAAQLIFPDVDKAIASGEEETFKDKAKDAGSFLQDYMDRRAQMKYARDDPNSSLIVPESERNFRSKYADPNHPMFTGGIKGLLSGGYLTPDQNSQQSRGDRRGDRRADKQDRRMAKYERRMDDGRDLSRKKQRRYDDMMDQRDMRQYGGEPADYADYGGRSPGRSPARSPGRNQGRRGGQKGGLIGGVKRMMKSGLLYLMVVNMPSEAELAEARQKLEAAKGM